jgi:hypothetical protein
MSPIYEVRSLQPHSGAIIMALYHYMKHPDKTNFDIRMSAPINKVYRITLEGKTRDEWVFRTGKDWPCYSRVYVQAADTEFVVNHDHSSVKEEFTIEHGQLYTGDVRTEAGIRVKFKGDFYNPRTLKLEEEFRTPSGLYVVVRRDYEVESAW